MRLLTFAVVLTAMFTVSAAADDAVEIKLPTYKEGERFKITKTEKTKTVEVAEAGGQKVNKDKEETRDIVYIEEVLTPGSAGEKPNKVVRTYQKYEEKLEKEKPTPPLDTPITIAKANGKYAFNTDGKTLGGFDKVLDEEFNKPAGEPSTKDMLPGKPVKVGDSWKIDTARFVKSLGEDVPLNAEKAKMSGKLLKTYKKDGKLFGVIEITGEFPIKSLGKGAPPIKSASYTMTVTADVCIDGTNPTEKTYSKLGFDVLIDTKELVLSIKSDGVLTSTREVLPKK